MKKTYSQPQIVIHGNVEKVTQGGQNGELLDATFPEGTPRGELTFS